MTLDREHAVAMGEADAPVSPTHINVGACRCPGSPHPFDTVDLKPELDVPMAIAANYAIGSVGAAERYQAGELTLGEANAEVQYVLTGIYLRHSISRWSFVDDKGDPLPITPANVLRLLPFGNGGGDVAEAADALYSEKIFAPLVAAQKAAKDELQTKKSSKDGLTADSTSASPPSGPTLPEPSEPSSPTSSDGQPLTV